jgi:Asp-tRNA(Asn)/Glu-tRNA(Gln) amidotransferase A subunit family amidase
LWPCPRDIRTLTVGYFEEATPAEDRADLNVLRELGVKLVPIELPEMPPADPLTVILSAEAATVFDGLLRTGNTAGLNRWPNAWREAEFIPAVEYLRANRIRTLLIREMERLLTQVDAYVGVDDLVITNLTGHPTVVMPNGLDRQGEVVTPTAITFTGRLFGESELLAVAHAYQQAAGFHLQHPPMEKLM